MNKKLKPLLKKTGFLFSGIIFFCVQPVFSMEKETKQLGDMVVTAEKRKGASSDFAGSISVKDDLFIDDHNISDLQELTTFVPNIFYKKASSGDSLISRGISTIDTSLYSPMGLYIDDIAYPLSYMQNSSLFDAQRVEFLRGPQGTLYGRNSESGVINIITNMPDNETRGKVSVETGNNSLFSSDFSVGGPILKDRLFMSIAGNYYRTDGYMENKITGDDDVADETSKSVFGKIRWVPTDDLEVLFAWDVMDRDLGISFLRFEGGPDKADRLKVMSSEKDASFEDGSGQSLKIIQKLKNFDFISITGHRLFNKDFIHDFDRTAKKLGYSDMDLESRSLSQEFRFSSVSYSNFSWLAGVYSGREDLDVDMIFNHVNPMMAKKRTSDSKTSSYAFFGQSSYEFSRKLKLTAGLRFENSYGSGNQEYEQGGKIFDYKDDFSENEFLPAASIMYSLNENIKAYAGYSRGWLAGGYNYFSATAKDNFSYDPEYTENYELGFKTSFFDKRFNADLTFFYTDIDDKQIREEIPGGGPGVWKFTNAAKAHTTGFELDVRALAGMGFELFAGAGLASSEVDDWEGSAGGKSVDYSGNQLPWAPEFTYNAGAGYYMENGVYFIGDVSGCGKRYFDAANSLEDGGYVLANLKAGMKYKKYDISLWCKNIFDEEYINKKVKNNFGNTIVEDGEPLTFGITLTLTI